MSSYADLPNLPAPQSDDALRKTAASQINLETSQAVAPIQSQITTAQGREDKSLAQIGQMFNNLQPVVDAAAQGVQTSYNQATSQQKAVFDAAQANLQKLRANRAGDAQALAQQIGGPVALDEWTQPFDDAATDLTYLGAGQQLHTLAYAEAGVQQALAFSGKVMPLLRTEQMASVRNQFEDQIREYQEQITALKSQKGAQVNKRFNELRTQELEYGLQRAQFALTKLDSRNTYNLAVKKAKTDKATADRQFKLDKQTFNLNKTKADRDFKIALRAAGNDDKRIKLAVDQYKLALAQTFGKGEDGVKTLDAVKEDHRVKEAARAAGLSDRELEARIAESKANTKIQLAKLHSDQRTEWVDILENAIHPKAGATVTHTYKAEATIQQMISGQSGVYADPTSSTGYSINITTSDTVGDLAPITDPNRLVEYLVTAVGDTSVMDQDRAEALVRSRLGLPADWDYGEKAPKTETAPTTPPPKDKTEPKDTGITSAEKPGGGTLETYKPTNKPDPHRLYDTPSGLMNIRDARAIAYGTGDYSKEERDKMYDWFIKRGFPLPKVKPGSGGDVKTNPSGKGNVFTKDMGKSISDWFTSDGGAGAKRKVYNTPSGRMRVDRIVAIATGEEETTPKERKAMQDWLKKQGFSVPTQYNESTAA